MININLPTLKKEEGKEKKEERRRKMFLGIDVGGANTKIATSDSSLVDSIYAPLWHDRAILYDVLRRVYTRLEDTGIDIEGVGVVMTGELCDCFRTRREGVLKIRDIVSTIFEGMEVEVEYFDRSGIFRHGEAIEEDPLAFASTNWLASAKFVSMMHRDVIFVDCGSTTTDVIPIVGGEIKAKRSDIERLHSHAHELLYSGVLRTNVAALLRKVKLRGEEYATSSELFAITADAYLVLGDITRADYKCESPNSYAFATEREAKSRESAMRRLARMLCCDLEEIGEEGAHSIAVQVKDAQVNELITALREMKERYSLNEVISAGIGDFIVKDAVKALDMKLLTPSWDRRLSAVLPAYAVAKLLEIEIANDNAGSAGSNDC